MLTEEFKSIYDAVQLVMQRRFDKLEGKDWKVYRVGTIIRVDIKEK